MKALGGQQPRQAGVVKLLDRAVELVPRPGCGAEGSHTSKELTEWWMDHLDLVLSHLQLGAARRIVLAARPLLACLREEALHVVELQVKSLPGHDPVAIKVDDEIVPVGVRFRGATVGLADSESLA